VGRKSGLAVPGEEPRLPEEALNRNDLPVHSRKGDDKAGENLFFNDLIDKAGRTFEDILFETMTRPPGAVS
jgi:hypothetical protein